MKTENKEEWSKQLQASTVKSEGQYEFCWRDIVPHGQVEFLRQVSTLLRPNCIRLHFVV